MKDILTYYSVKFLVRIVLDMHYEGCVAKYGFVGFLRCCIMMGMDRALYQKHRPQAFKDIIEQPQVVSVLEKAAEKGVPAHAYLFTGPRGIGKTSVARIFARSLGCKAIDIFEIDAASHTGVEHIRELTASVYTQPVESSYKVYILDEVHMLSKAAFNAFLKTLEEPPAYAIFILVTTEEDKVPETIVSRCVSLQFRQPSLSALQKIAQSVAKKEGHALTEQSATLIALMAEGSFRDALTLVQKVLFVTDGGDVPHDTVEEVLGAPRHQLVNEYLGAVIEGSVPKGVAALEAVASINANVPLFAQLCIRKLRAALLLRGGIADAVDGYSEEDVSFITSLSKKENVTLALLQQLIEASYAIPRSYIKVLPLEYLLLKEV